MLSLFFLIATQSMAVDQVPAGQEIEDAVSVAVTRAGLSELGGAAGVLLPSEPIALDPISQSGGTWCVNYEFALKKAEVSVEIDSISIVPSPDTLQVDVDLMVAINDAGNPFELDYELLCVGEDCPGYVRPFLVEAAVPLGIRVATNSSGEKVFDAVLGTASVTHYLKSSDIDLDCNIGSVESVLDYLGLSLFDLIIGLAEDAIQDAVSDAMTELEVQIDEALAQARLDQVIEVQGSEIQLLLEPEAAEIDNSGMQLVMSGLADAAKADDCIAAFDEGGSLSVPSSRPGISALPAGVETAGLVADEFVNQLLYAVWRSGVLCYQLDDSSDLGLPINTSLLGIIGGDGFEALFPEAKALVVLTEPIQPPTAAFGGTNDVDLKVEGLNVNFFADLDYRMARALGVTLEADVGADLEFNGTTGAMDVVLNLGGDSIRVIPSANEIVPESSEQVAEGMSSLIQTVLDTVLADALGGLSFQLGSVQGVGLQSLQVDALGTESDWMLASVDVGAVPYGAGGCADDGSGCNDADAGCGQGCSTGRSGLWPLWLAVLPIGLMMRRRRIET